jgi:hypothetical protein
MECADNATFNQRPKAIYGIGMNSAADIFASAMTDNAVITPLVKKPIARVIIGRKQADFIGNCLMDEIIKGFGVNIINHFRYDLPPSAHSADNGSLAAWPTPAASLVAMLVFGLSANESFIDFHKTHQLAKFGIVEASPDSVTHRPRRTVGTRTNHSMNLQGAYAFFATQHKVDYLEPNLQGIIRILENRSHQDGETIASLGRTATLPVPRAAKFIDLIATAPWAPYAIGPAPGSKIGFAGIFIREFGFQFCESHGSYGLGFHRDPLLGCDDYQDNTSKTLCHEVDNRL